MQTLYMGYTGFFGTPQTPKMEHFCEICNSYKTINYCKKLQVVNYFFKKLHLDVCWGCKCRFGLGTCNIDVQILGILSTAAKNKN